MIIDQLFENNKKQLNEVDPRNFDSDEDYYAAVNAPTKRRSAPSDYPYSQEQDDDYFREIFRKKREAAKKAAQDKEQSVTENRRYKLEESRILESSTYKQFHRVGRMLAERKMSEKEILDVFAQAEQGMTDKGTGANRTALGRGKDTVGRGITSAKDAITKVLSSIQNSAPVAGVDVAYDQATDALANAVGNNSKVMDSIKKYRLLAKEYPKTQLFVKTALVALAGLATGGAALPVIAGLTAAVDSAIKGEKLSNIIGKGAGASLMGLGAQEVSSMLSGTDAAATSADASSGAGQFKDTDSMGFAGRGTAGPEAYLQPQDGQFQLPDADAAMNQQADVAAAQDWINADEAGKAEIEQTTGMSGAQLQDIAVGNDLKPGVATADSLAAGEEVVPTGAEGFGGGTYTVQAGDQGGYIAQANGISFPDLKGLNPQITNWNKLPVGTELQLPPANTHTGSVWDGSATSAPATAPNATTSTTPEPELVPQGPFSKPMAPATPAGERSERFIPQLDGSWIDASTGQVADPAKLQASQDAVRNAFRPRPSMQGLRESINFKTIPADQLIDQKLTVLNWALLESVGRKSKSINLTSKGVYTVFENVDRYRRAIVEYTQPGREQIPDLLRPDMPGAPAPQTAKPGMIGRGLNWLDKKAGQVGGALSNFGHQFTTGVTKEKLKMNWHQAGKPTDSDQLAAFLAQQKVPQEVITDVFGKMGIPYTAPATAEPAASEPAQATAKAQQPWAIAAVNPATGKQWTPDELKARYPKTTADVAKMAASQDLSNVMLRPDAKIDPGAIAAARQSLGTANLPQATTSVSPTATPSVDLMKKATASLQGGTALSSQELKQVNDYRASKGAPAISSPAGWDDPKSANYVGRREVARRQSAQPAAPAQATPSYAGPTGYGSVKMNAPTGASLPRTIKPAAPAGTKVTAGGPTAAERAALDKRIAAAAAQPVAETVKQVKRMMETVTSRADVQRIKDYIDYHMGANLTESAQLKRNRLLSEVTQLAATRRRAIASRMA